MDVVTLMSLLVNVAVATIFISILFICLKIKTTKKTPELLGTVGTVKTFDEDRSFIPATTAVVGSSSASSPPPSLNTTRNSQQIHNNGPIVVIPPPSAPSPASLGNNSAGHSPVPSPYYPEHRTPSRAGERKLPDIPRRDSDNGSVSELYDTLGPPEANREGSDSETETDGARANHPYARVKKRHTREHPYATVSHLNRGSTNEDGALTEHQNDDHLEGHSAPPPPTVHPPPPPENAAQTHFSGDSQDSSKGYTSISVREPLCHIQTQVAARSIALAAAQSRQNATYMAVSEASEVSDDMYAAIDDPTYIPAGGISQTNSDTYAVINLPDYDSGSQTYQKLDGAEEDEDVSSPVHTYSKIDKNKKKRGAVPPPPLPPPHHPIGPNPSSRPVSFNIDDMYAKVQKSPPPRPVSEDTMMSMGASAGALRGGSLTPRTTRVRSAPWDPTIDETSRRSQNWDPTQDDPTRRVQRGDVNYSDFETSIFDPKQRRAGPVQPSPKFHHDSTSTTRPGQKIGSDGGYETVPNQDQNQDSSSLPSPPTNEHGYERVVEYWLRRPPGSVSAHPDTGYDFVGDEENRLRLREHGYETVTDNAQQMIGYPPNHRIGAVENEPPYAVLTSRDFEEEEEEEGYETIPASERRNGRKESQEDDPGYESVQKKESVISFGYEVIQAKSVLRRESASNRSGKKDPGYETVKNVREHDYETVTKKKSTATDYGYETVDNVQRRFESINEDRLDDVGEMTSAAPTTSTSHHAPPSLPLSSLHNQSLHSPVASSRSASMSPKLGTPDTSAGSLSPSVRMSVRQVSATPPQRPTQRSSVTVIELRNDAGEGSPTFIDDDDDDNDVDAAAEVNTTIFV